MEERKASKRCGGVFPFIIGFLATCILGWAVIPGLFFEKVEQPLRFSHAIHVEGQGMDCDRITSYNVCYTKLLRAPSL